jgi:uncharacterized membrane protein YcgQ (UPF0703/DUF1980 family)
MKKIVVKKILMIACCVISVIMVASCLQRDGKMQNRKNKWVRNKGNEVLLY